jgi:hypothetical protein
MNSRLYIAGPMSSLPDKNLPAFAAATEQLRAAGYHPVNPGRNGQRPGWEWLDYMRAALHDLIDCHAVALLPGWEHSRGARIERHLAIELGMPVHPLELWLAARSGVDLGGAA